MEKMQMEAGDGGKGDGFVHRLLQAVAGMHDSERYSDLKVKLMDGREMRAHKFVLAARSDKWSRLGDGITVLGI